MAKRRLQIVREDGLPDCNEHGASEILEEEDLRTGYCDIFCGKETLDRRDGLPDQLEIGNHLRFWTTHHLQDWGSPETDEDLVSNPRASAG